MRWSGQPFTERRPVVFSADDAAAVLAARRIWSTLAGTGDAHAGVVADQLYARWWAAPAESGSLPAASHRGSPPLAGRLRVAHSGSGRWITRCRVIALGAAGSVVVTTPSGFDRALTQGDHWCPTRPGLPVRVGDEVVGVDRSGGYESEGWWRTWSGGWDMTRSAPDVSRAYLSVTPAGVEEVPRRLPDALDGAGIPWTMKIGVVEGMLARPDAVVCYVRDADREAMLALITSVLGGALAPGPRVPFTSPAAPGLCWAEDPGDGASFGQVRCGLLAGAFESGGAPVPAAEAAFRAAGLDPARPHLRSQP